MKKLTSILLLFVIPVLLVGCSAQKAENSPSAAQPMTELIDRLCEGVDVPAYESTQLTEENFTYYTFVPYASGLSAYQADALINATPHALVLVRSEDGNTAEIAQQMLENADMNKWICVSAEEKQAAYTEHYAVLVMSSTKITKGILANFETAVDDGKATVLEAVAAPTPDFDDASSLG